MPTIAVTGMGCEGCADIVENAIGDVDGVESVSADHETGVVEYAGDPDAADVEAAVEFAGYGVESSDGETA